MTITIHRANQIGGCITIIEHDGCKIIIDLGSNLPGNNAKELTKKDVASITQGTNAIFYTHYHGDHIGLHHLVNAAVPQFIGAGAKEVILCKYRTLSEYDDFSEKIASAESMNTYMADQSVAYQGCEKIKVTPYFVSHSAFDSYMLLIECEGKRILHTGDFRKHGYLGKGLIPTLNKKVGKVDILITEGTMLGRRTERVVTENDIKYNVIKALEHKYVFALGSSTDIERLASFHAACKKTGRLFLVDKYQQDILDIFTKYAGAKSDLFKFDRTFTLINFKTANVQRKLMEKGFFMPVRMGMEKLVKGMLDVYNDEDPWLIYSMWSGYAQEGKDYSNSKVIDIRSLFSGRIFDGSHEGFHTSGHADVDTLEEVCQKVKPSIGVIPIHKDPETSFQSVGCRVISESEAPCKDLSIIIK